MKQPQVIAPWHKTVRVGDVLIWPSGKLRIVRRVSKYAPATSRHRINPARRTNCYFAIQHCSWTHRPYTLYSVAELHLMGVRPTGIRHKLNEFDEDLEKDFDAARSSDCKFDCCDVQGIP